MEENKKIVPLSICIGLLIVTGLVLGIKFLEPIEATSKEPTKPTTQEELYWCHGLEPRVDVKIIYFFTTKAMAERARAEGLQSGLWAEVDSHVVTRTKEHAIAFAYNRGASLAVVRDAKGLTINVWKTGAIIQRNK